MSHLQKIADALDEQIRDIEQLPFDVLKGLTPVDHAVALELSLLFNGFRIHCIAHPQFLLLTYPQGGWQLMGYPVSILNRDKFPTTRYILRHEPVQIWHGREECIRMIARHWNEEPSEKELAEIVERFRNFEERLK